MKFLKRVVSGGSFPQHQTLNNDHEYDDESLQQKPFEEDVRTTSSESTPVGLYEPFAGSMAVQSEEWSGETTPPHDTSFLNNTTETKEPVWKRRARAYQASQSQEMRSNNLTLPQSSGVAKGVSQESSTTQEPKTPGFSESDEAFDAISTTSQGRRTTGPVDLDSVGTDDDSVDPEMAELQSGERPAHSSQQPLPPRYSHDYQGEMKLPPSPVHDNSILQNDDDETAREEGELPKRIRGLMKKVMDPSFRKSVMNSKDKAWKTVLACHNPKTGFSEANDDGINKRSPSSELPFWKRLETNLFSKEPHDAETSFESTSTTGSATEIITLIKRAGTSITGLVKETTAACTQPPLDEDEGLSFDDQSSRGSTFYSRAESKASTNHNNSTRNNDERRLWQEFFEDENENLSLGDEATNPESGVGGRSAQPTNDVSMK